MVVVVDLPSCWLDAPAPGASSQQAGAVTIRFSSQTRDWLVDQGLLERAFPADNFPRLHKTIDDGAPPRWARNDA